MTRWKKFVVAATTGATLVVTATVVASASGTGRDALRAAGGRAVLMASTSTGTAQPRGGSASGTGLGPIQVSIGKTWDLQVQLITSGTLTVACGPFLPGTQSSSGAQVTVEEVVGDKVGHAQGFVNSLTCDGARHPVQVSALVSDLPFRSAPGAVSVSANACGQDPSSFQFVCQQGNAVSAITVK
ncbi:MAG: hypothetical protein E6J41_06140 [Chloroflexi bacterium]|nr:MAG: hypothetical protein E6J41_06140 [Chloroflexota bacterium]